MIGICAYVLIKKSKDNKTPYEIWTSYYSNASKKESEAPSIMENDMHHFYRKNQSYSVRSSPAFIPHISNHVTFRDSMLDLPNPPQNRRRNTTNQENYIHNL
jgi:hypothetical protein